jgi:Ca2+/Na+ antiporter
VEITVDAAVVLNVPTFFVAVILAAAVSSVPDTFLSVGAALRGDDSGAVSNAFGSNIFDICVCLSIPLLVNAGLTGWQPVSMLQDGVPIPGLVGLRILLAVLTGLTLIIIWHKQQVTRAKAILLCFLYLVFVAYAVLGSLNILKL